MIQSSGSIVSEPVSGSGFSPNCGIRASPEILDIAPDPKSKHALVSIGANSRLVKTPSLPSGIAVPLKEKPNTV